MRAQLAIGSFTGPRTHPLACFLPSALGSQWRRLTYHDALTQVRQIGQALLDLGLDETRPVAILSENSVDHALLALGAMHVGVPVAPISPAYSLMSKDYAKLKYIFELLEPGLVFASDPARFDAALSAVGATATPVDQLLWLARSHGRCRVFVALTEHDGEDPLHVGFDRHSQGRDQHPSHALRQSADARAGLAVSPTIESRPSWTGCRGTTPSAATSAST